MSKHISNLSELSRNTVSAFDIASRSSAGFAQQPIAQALHGWSEVTIVACRHARMTMELPRKIVACQSPDDVAALQSSYLNETINSYLHAQAAFASLLCLPVTVSDVEITRDALRLEPIVENSRNTIEAEEDAELGRNAEIATRLEHGERDERPDKNHALREQRVAA